MTFFQLDQFISRHVTGRAESLFQRDLEQHEAALEQAISGKSVLVIGGAGTIGSSFIKALLPFQPGRLYVMDLNENGLTELTRDLRSTDGLFVPEDYKTYPINFADPVFEKIWRQEGPFHIVANFAAHKHVRSEKDQYSIEAMIGNNAIRAQHLLELISTRPPEHFFCVSTDKAANPVNVMGASKKLMEEVILSYAASMKVTTARFANVAFSNGSLPDGFLTRLLKKQPLSSPTDVKRYFVSPQESGQLCLLACILGQSGEIFFPKLSSGEMKTFSDIATILLLELGLEPERCASEAEAKRRAVDFDPAKSRRYPVYFFESDTSGEKAFEEFYTETEAVDWARFEALGVITGKTGMPLPEIAEVFGRLAQVFEGAENGKADIIRVLTEALPGFHHLETGKGLDQKM
ncbi:MAG: polysaccharide biosynthesis protein [Saprospiraceae bacterium]|nr:polysaccharide biosynthesis protein [Saprospiraceae bacterium]MDZ4704919.1 polysaccharide biosynthesis protein [Saprospiraceae bacterium]